MAIAVETHATNDNTGDDASVTVNMPTTRPADDFYLACIGGDSEDYTWSGNANFTDLAISESGSNQIGGACFYSGYKIGGASEPASYDFTRSSAVAENMLCAMLRFSGVDTTTPIGATSAANIGDATTATAPAITATSDDSIIVRIYAIDSDNVISYASATDIYHTLQGNGWGNIGIAYESSPGNGVTTGTEVATLDAQDAWVAWTIELMPASVSDTTAPTIYTNSNQIIY